MLYSYAKRVAGMLRTYFADFKHDPRRQQSYREQSSRQARPKYYTATINGFSLIQRLPRT